MVICLGSGFTFVKIPHTAALWTIKNIPRDLPNLHSQTSSFQWLSQFIFTLSLSSFLASLALPHSLPPSTPLPLPPSLPPSLPFLPPFLTRTCFLIPCTAFPWQPARQSVLCGRPPCPRHHRGGEEGGRWRGRWPLIAACYQPCEGSEVAESHMEDRMTHIMELAPVICN